MQNITIELVQALAHARTSKRWLVLVCPDDAQLMQVRRSLSAAITPEDRFSGRTVALADGGHLSVVSQADEPFQPFDEPISVQFMGHWTNKNTGTNGMAQWRAAASEIL